MHYSELPQCEPLRIAGDFAFEMWHHLNEIDQLTQSPTTPADCRLLANIVSGFIAYEQYMIEQYSIIQHAIDEILSSARASTVRLKDMAFGTATEAICHTTSLWFTHVAAGLGDTAALHECCRAIRVILPTQIVTARQFSMPWRGYAEEMSGLLGCWLRSEIIELALLEQSVSERELPRIQSFLSQIHDLSELPPLRAWWDRNCGNVAMTWRKALDRCFVSNEIAVELRLEFRRAIRDPTPSNQPQGQLSAAERDIIDVISTAGHRLTTTQVLRHLEQKRGAASVGTTKIVLAGLTRRGLLINRKDVRPRGYGLPGW